MFPFYAIAEDDRMFWAWDRMGVEDALGEGGRRGVEDNLGFGVSRQLVREVCFLEGGAGGAG